jgi:hypothetical protein
LRPKDEPRADRVFISVLSFMPWFDVVGWIVGREGMKEQWFREGTPGFPKCWYVPRAALHPMDKLPAVDTLRAEETIRPEMMDAAQ